MRRTDVNLQHFFFVLNLGIGLLLCPSVLVVFALYASQGLLKHLLQTYHVRLVSDRDML
jgi:hypothetical protein